MKGGLEKHIVGHEGGVEPRDNCSGRSEWLELPARLKCVRVKPQCRVCAMHTRRAGFGSGLERRCSGYSQTLLRTLCLRANTHHKYFWLNSGHGGIIRMIQRGNLT